MWAVEMRRPVKQKGYHIGMYGIGKGMRCSHE